MMDHILEEALLARFKDLPILAGSHFYLGHDNTEHKLPAVTVVSNSEPLASSDRVFRSELEITIESEAHDTESAVHAERVEAVRIALSNRAEVIAAMNATHRLHIYGYAPLGSEQSAGAARFTTKLKYRFGFGLA